MNSKNLITGEVYYVSDTLVDWVDKGKIQSIDISLIISCCIVRKKKE